MCIVIKKQKIKKQKRLFMYYLLIIRFEYCWYGPAAAVDWRFGCGYGGTPVASDFKPVQWLTAGRGLRTVCLSSGSDNYIHVVWKRSFHISAIGKKYFKKHVLKNILSL